MPKRLCRCGAIIDGRTLCDACRVTTPMVARGATTHERGYDYTWRRASERIRAVRPLCEVCEAFGRIRPSRDVHHIVPIRDDRSRRFERSNLIAVCRECHRVIEGMGRTQLDEFLKGAEQCRE